MRLTEAQLCRLDKDGFLLLPDLFSHEEVAALNERVPALWAERTDANICEKHSDEVRMALAIHKRDELFARLAFDPRLVHPAEQIIGEPFYIQQTKVNNKTPMSNEIWQWHHDFGNHHFNDGVERPLAMNIHVFLDDVTHFNGPICFVPGSHTNESGYFSDHPVSYDDETTSFAVYAITPEALLKQINASGHQPDDLGIRAATGGRGSVLIFFDTTLHCSPANFSPWKRTIFSMIVNPISNKYQNADRPDHLHHKDTTAVRARADASLFIA